MRQAEPITTDEAALAAIEAKRAAKPNGGAGEAKPAANVLTIPSLLDPPFTDLGNAERLVMLHGDNLRYCYRLARWFVWTGRKWEVDEGERAEQLASETVRHLYAAISTIEDSERREKIAGWARKSESERSLRAAVSLARSRPGIPVKPDDLDRDPWLLNCPNGTLDLKTGHLGRHERADLITKCCAAEYDPEAVAPIFEAFLRRIFGGNDRLARFVQRCIGYALTGDTSEQVAFIWWGAGANGKSTFVNACLDLLADYGLSTPSETLLLKHSDSIPNDVARLKGARFVAATETEDGRRLAESKLKAMTGQDRISARFMRAEWFDFQPSFKLFLATNHKPEIKGTDWAIWRRIRLVPFTVTIPDDEQDKALGDKLRAELPGILAWAVRGCLEWQRIGLQPPDEVIAATNEYRNESDQLGRFIDERCITGDGFQARARALYLEYKKWADGAGETVLTETAFGRRLVERGFAKEKRGSVVYEGIGLNADAG